MNDDKVWPSPHTHRMEIGEVYPGLVGRHRVVREATYEEFYLAYGLPDWYPFYYVTEPAGPLSADETLDQL